MSIQLNPVGTLARIRFKLAANINLVKRRLLYGNTDMIQLLDNDEFKNARNHE